MGNSFLREQAKLRNKIVANPMLYRIGKMDELLLTMT